MKQIHIKMDDALHKKIRLFAAIRAMTIQDAVLQLLDSRLSDPHLHPPPFLERVNILEAQDA